jgi:hypothetical protein
MAFKVNLVLGASYNLRASCLDSVMTKCGIPDKMLCARALSFGGLRHIGAWLLAEWSDKNPSHLPIFIEINAVDEPENVLFRSLPRLIARSTHSITA